MNANPIESRAVPTGFCPAGTLNDLIKTNRIPHVMLLAGHFNDLILQILTATRWICYANLADAVLIQNSLFEPECVAPALCNSNIVLVHLPPVRNQTIPARSEINKCRVVCGPIVNLDGRKGIKELCPSLKYCITRAHIKAAKKLPRPAHKEILCAMHFLIAAGTAAVLCVSSLAGGLIKYIRDDFYDHRINWPRTIS